MKFTEEDRKAYAANHQLTSAAAEYVERSSIGVGRNIGTAPNRPSFLVEFPSFKMGCTMNLESGHEYGYAVELERDKDVIAYYEQPPRVELLRDTPKGKRPYPYTPDFIVLGKTGLLIVQVKESSKLEELVETSLSWTKCDNNYVDLAARDLFASIGIRHVVIPSSRICKQVTQNLLTLRMVELADADPAAERTALAHVLQRRVVTMSEVLQKMNTQDCTSLLQLVAHGRIFADLSKHSLSSPSTCLLAASPELLSTELIEEIERSRHVVPSSEDTVSRDLVPSSSHLVRGLANLSFLKGEIRTRSEKEHARRLRLRRADGESQGKSAIAALTPRYASSGNRTLKRPASVLQFAREELKRCLEGDSNPGPLSVYRRYQVHAELHHPAYRPVGKTTARKIIAELEQETAESRGGKRLANSKSSPSSVEVRALKSMRPFELAQCDHYLADIEVVVGRANGKTYTARPWITVLIDCYTQCVLAFGMSLRAPNKGTSSQVLRDCARRHGRLPETIISDNGSDFTSVHYSTMAAQLNITIMFRPPGNGRFGGEVERFFGKAKTFWLDLLPGSIKTIRFSRSISSHQQPSAKAELSLVDLWHEMEAFSQWVGRRPSGDSSECPEAKMLSGLRQFPFSGIKAQVDLAFLVKTALKQKPLKVSGNTVIHAGDLHMWHDALAAFAGRSVPTRIDGQDPRILYALLDNQWVVCKAYAALQAGQQSHAEAMAYAVWARDGSSLRELMKADSDRQLIAEIERREMARKAPPAREHNEAQLATDRPTSCPPSLGSFKAISTEPMSVEDW